MSFNWKKWSAQTKTRRARASAPRFRPRLPDLAARLPPALPIVNDPPDHPDTLAARQALGVNLRDRRRLGAAAYHLRPVLDARERALGADHPDTQACRLELVIVRLPQRKSAGAEPLLLEAYAGLRRWEADRADLVSPASLALERLVQLYEGWGKKDKAIEWRLIVDGQKRP